MSAAVKKASVLFEIMHFFSRDISFVAMMLHCHWDVFLFFVVLFFFNKMTHPSVQVNLFLSSHKLICVFLNKACQRDVFFLSLLFR